MAQDLDHSGQPPLGDRDVSIPEIAAMLGCSPEDIYALLLREGQPDHPRERRAHHPHAPATRAIAELLRCSPDAIEELLGRASSLEQRAVAQKHRERSYPFDASRVRALYVDQGKTVGEVAADLHTSPAILVKAMEEWHIPRRRRGRRPKHPT